MTLAAAALLPLLAAAPRAPDLVDLARVIPDATIDLRYATPRNVAGKAMYPPGARCLLLRPVAERLARAAARLRAAGYTLRLWDCYRPISVQRELWRIQPTPGLVADPRTGSSHNRGAAVDLALAGPAGAELELPTDLDAFGPRARSGATEGLSPAARRHRDLLRAAMRAEGFRPIRLEWWHFEAPEARGAPVLDAPLAP
ncbi:MAG TPA: M15 family metallopeptidase [Anaeromyxobacter sp.]